MYKLLRMAVFALPLALGGVALAQGSGTSGSAGAPGTNANSPSVTGDTRTPVQQKAGKVDETTPELPGDATKPSEIPDTVPQSDTTGLPGTGMTTPGSGATDKDAHKADEGPSNADQAPRSRTTPIKRRTDVDHQKANPTDNANHDTLKDQKQLQRDQLDSDK